MLNQRSDKTELLRIAKRLSSINLKVLYGQTEATVFVSLHRDGDVDPNTVGPAFPGVEIKIENGEVMWFSGS